MVHLSQRSYGAVIEEDSKIHMAKDSDTLPALTPGDILTRGRFSTTYQGSEYVVDVDFFDFSERIRLYRDGVLVDSSRSNAEFELGNAAAIEASLSTYGMKYVHLRLPDRSAPVPLQPVEGTAEGWRAGFHRNHPRISTAIASLSLIVVVAAVIIDVPVLINYIGHQLGRLGGPEFQIPAFPISGPMVAVVAIVGAIAAIERAISMKHNDWIDD